MFGAIAGGIASALAGGAMSKLFGGGQKAASGGIQGDVLATDNNTVGMGDAGIKSAIQGSNVPNPDEAVPSFVSGAMAKAGKGLLEGTLQAGTSAVSDKLLDFVGLGGTSAAEKGKDTRAGADASSAGMVDAGCENQKELTNIQLDNQKEIAEMQNETQKEIAGIQSATSRQNTKDQVYAQNEMLAYQQKESTARVASIMENTNLSKQQQVSEIMRQMLTQAQTAGQYFTNDQIKEMTRKVSAEVDLVHQQTQNQRYGSSHIGATAKDISNVVTDAASGVVDIFHGIDKAVPDTWNNFWKDGKADGIGFTFFNVTLIIFALSVLRLLNLLLRLVAFLLFLNPQCLASISRWITASSSWKRFCLFVCRALSSIMVICMLTAIRLLLTFVMSLYLLLRS